MAVLASRNGKRKAKQQRRYALALGARSAFDLSGLGLFEDDLFDSHRRVAEPSRAVAADMARVMRTFGLSVHRGERAVAAGHGVDEFLEPENSGQDEQPADEEQPVMPAFPEWE